MHDTGTIPVLEYSEYTCTGTIVWHMAIDIIYCNSAWHGYFVIAILPGTGINSMLPGYGIATSILARLRLTKKFFCRPRIEMHNTWNNHRSGTAGSA